MLEYESVMTRAEHLMASNLQGDDIAAILDAIGVVGERVRLAYLWRPILGDAQDDMVLETAVNGRADVLVTVNNRHFQPAAATFGIDVVSPAEGLDRVRHQNEKE
jgi:predicted nucleic acid-binding protein